MTVIALASAKGSPGVTTATLALAATWPGRALLVEADPAGGDVLAGYGRGELPPAPGLLELATAARRELTPRDLLAHSRPLDDQARLRLLAGVSRPGAAGHRRAGVAGDRRGLRRRGCGGGPVGRAGGPRPLRRHRRPGRAARVLRPARGGGPADAAADPARPHHSGGAPQPARRCGPDARPGAAAGRRRPVPRAGGGRRGRRAGAGGARGRPGGGGGAVRRGRPRGAGSPAARCCARPDTPRPRCSPLPPLGRPGAADEVPPAAQVHPVVPAGIGRQP